MELDIETKQKYLLLRDNFKKIKEEKNNIINEHVLVINKNKIAISGLERDIENSRPLIEGCDKKISCKRCDIYSMGYQGATPNPDKVHVYECIICGKVDYHT